MGRSLCWRVPTVLAFALAFALSCFAQEFRATLTGHITDPNGAGVPGATITVTNQQTSEKFTATSAGDGNYTVPFLQPGRYTVTVEAQGFKKAESNLVELHTADKATMDVALELGQLDQTVNVNSDAPLLEADTGSRGQVIENMRVNELPLNGRNPIMLATLSPGVQFNGNPQFTRPFDNGDNAQFSINGGLQRHNAFLLDGAPNDALTDVDANRTRSSNNIAFVPPVDATEEFKVQTNAYDAAFGRTGGGVINVTIKPGGRDFHGSIYEFARRYQWEANKFGNNARGRFTSGPFAGQEVQPRYVRDQVTGANLGGHKQDQYGFVLSGPLLIPHFGEGGPVFANGRDKTFFLVNFENFKGVDPASNITTAPTLLERQGDFSKSGVIIYDPLTTRPDPARPGKFIRDPFPGNVIPANRINPVGQAIVNGFSLPNTQGSDPFNRYNNFVVNFPGTDSFHSLVTRIDHNFSDRERIFFRYAHNRRDQIQIGGNGRIGLGIDAQDPLVRVNNGAVLDSVTTLSPSTIINARVSFSRFLQAAYRKRASPFDATSLGFPASFSNARPTSIVPRVEFNDSPIGSIPEFGSRNPNSNITNTWSFPVNVTHITGKHTLRFGVEYRDFQVHQSGGSFVWGGGLFCFSRDFTVQDPQAVGTAGQGSAIAALLLGYPSGSGGCNDGPTQVQNVSPLSFHWGYYAGYIQDDFKVSPKLTLNLGLRYDYESPPVEYHNRQNAGFAFDQPNPLAAAVKIAAGAANCPACANLTGGLLFAGVNGQSREAFRKDRNNFGPRFGIAYKWNDKTVLRGGYGLYYFPQAEYGGSLGFNVNTLFNPTVGGGAQQFIPAFTLSNPYPSGLQQPTGASLGLSTQIGSSIQFVNPNHVIPSIQEFSAGLQRELPWRMRLDVSYVGSRTRNILTGDAQGGGGRNINVLPASVLQQIQNDTTGFFSQSVSNPFAGLVPTNSTLNAANISRRALLLPYPEFGSVTVSGENVGKLWYDSAQASLEKRLGGGLVFVASYTFSKTLGALAFLNSQDAAPTKSVVDFDSTHVLVVSSVYQLPFGTGKRFFSGAGKGANLALGGWEYNVIANFKSGRPINLPTGSADLIGDPTISNSSFERYFNTCTLFTSGSNAGKSLQPNAARNALEPCSNPVWRTRPNNTDYLIKSPFRLANLREPWAPQFDMSLNKSFNFTENLRFQIRLEAFNVFNTPLFGNPNTSVGSLEFGRLLPQNAVRNNDNYRQLQLGLKFYF
jgi:hypothetical protein